MNTEYHNKAENKVIQDFKNKGSFQNKDEILSRLKFLQPQAEQGDENDLFDFRKVQIENTEKAERHTRKELIEKLIDAKDAALSISAFIGQCFIVAIFGAFLIITLKQVGTSQKQFIEQTPQAPIQQVSRIGQSVLDLAKSINNNKGDEK